VHGVGQKVDQYFFEITAQRTETKKTAKRGGTGMRMLRAAWSATDNKTKRGGQEQESKAKHGR
jgi:hypothetical protein